MPTFCRHNRLIQNCPICAREQSIEARPVLSSSAPRSSQPRADSPRRSQGATAPGSSRRGGSPGRAGVRVRQLERGEDDGYRSALIPGVRSSTDALRLAHELGFAAARLELLTADPPGLYREIAAEGDLEERTWLAFLLAYLGPLESGDPFVAVSAIRTSWASGELPELDDVETGPRTAHEPGRGTRTLEAYRAWAQRAGGQQAAFGGETGWSPERRFARVFERLALPGLHRDARYELLVSLGRLGLYQLRPGSLAFGGENSVTHAAKRALGIGDPLLLDRRAQALAQAADIPLEALDLGLFNWERGERAGVGVPPELEPDGTVAAHALDALDL